MIKRSSIFPIMIATLLGFHAASFGAPSIDTIIGEISNGSSIQLQGTDFSIKSSGPPLVWDDLEDGSCNTQAAIGTWASTNVLATSTENNRHAASSYTAHHNFLGEATAGFRGTSSPTSRQWFIQYWVFLADNWDWGTSTYGGGDQFLSNVKWLRLWNPGSTNENFYVQFWWSETGNAYSNPENVSGITDNFNVSFSKRDIARGQWHCLQFELLDSSGNGTTDAEFRFWHNGTLKETRDNFAARNTSAYKRPLFIGFYNAWGGGNGHANDFYIDEVYVDTTWARIEIGNAANYDQCTHREIQLPQSWSENTITFSVNTGTFSTGDTAYLFVIDNNGDTSPAEEITIGQAGRDPGSDSDGNPDSSDGGCFIKGMAR